MVFPSFEKLFTVESDVRNVAVGSILTQEERSVAFHSEKLSDAKRKYSSYDLELYTLV